MTKLLKMCVEIISQMDFKFDYRLCIIALYCMCDVMKRVVGEKDIK